MSVQPYEIQIKIYQAPFTRRLGWGLFGGLAATLVMDLLLLGAMVAAGLPAFTCYVIVGDTMARLFSLLGLPIAGGVPLGIAAHYVIGPVMGGIFSLAVVKVAALRLDTLKKRVIWAVLFAEILSQPMLALSPILLAMTTFEMLQWYGGSMLMHMLWGVILGIVCSRCLR